MLKSKKSKNFKKLLSKYLDIKGLDIILVMENGIEIELFKNRSLENDEIVTFDKTHREMRIPIAQIKTVDLFAA